MERWNGKLAVVTGASAGIGAAIVVALANHGMKVVGLARRPELVEKLSLQVEHKTGRVYSRQCDICSETEIAAAFSWINDEFGGIDILVNNAGIIRQGTLVDVGTREGAVSADVVRQILETNVVAMITCSQYATKSMRARHVAGHIINMNSILGHYQLNLGQGVSLLNAYPPSKFAVTAVTEQMRNEFAHSDTNINVTMLRWFGHVEILDQNRMTNEIYDAGVDGDRRRGRSRPHRTYHDQFTDVLRSGQSISPGIVGTELFAEGGMDQVQDLLKKTYICLQPVDVAGAVIYTLSQPQRVNIQELILRPAGDKL